MVFLGLEKPVEYGRQQIFDPTTAQMVLQAQDQYANALYRDYVRGLEDMKEFNKEYGNFITPILADQEWYNKNVIDKVRGTIQRMYEAGIDPTRSVQGRAAISQLINSIDVGSINKLRSSAANAEEFLKARKQLEAQGLYNPLLAKYDGPDINTYSTLDRFDENGNIVSGSGVWDKMSPTRITDMATFGNPYFEGMKPIIHKETKNGIQYNVEEITMDRLTSIANDHFNELVSTPQGQLMYKYYKDLAGGDANPNSDAEARAAFNNAVAAGQKRRIYRADDYDNTKALELDLRRRQLEIQQERNNIIASRGGFRSSSGSGGSGNSDKTPVSYYEPLYQNLVVSTLNKDPMRTAVFSNKEFTVDMGSSILGAQRNIAEQYFADSSKSIYGGGRPTAKRFGIDYTKGNASGNSYITGNSKLNYTVDPNISETKEFKTKFNNNYLDYLHQFSGGNQEGFSSMFANSYRNGQAKVDELSYSGSKLDNVKGQQYVSFSKEDINNIYSAKEISARAAGITGSILEDAKRETQKLRNRLKAYSSLIMKATRPIGVGLRDIGQYGVFSESTFKAVDDGTVIDGEFVYKTPFMSTPNPNASKDDILNLSFDQDMDLERKIMDNPAIRKGFGVTNNSGTIDNTLSDPNPWYTLEDDFSDFDWNY